MKYFNSANTRIQIPGYKRFFTLSFLGSKYCCSFRINNFGNLRCQQNPYNHQPDIESNVAIVTILGQVSRDLSFYHLKLYIFY